MDNKYLEQKWYSYLKTKYGLNDDDMDEYLDSFYLINKGDIITPTILANFYNEEIKNEHLTIDDATKIIAQINMSVNKKPIKYLDTKSYLSYVIPICHNFVVQKIGIRDFFNSIDTNCDGKITCDELIAILYKVNKNFTPEQIDSHKLKIKTLCKKADVNGDGFISYDEFKDFMASIISNPEVHI